MSDVTTASFPPGTTVTIAPPQIVNAIISTIIGGAPFARALTRYPTTSGKVIWPTAAPAGQGWVAEGAPLPTVTLGDATVVVAVAKLAGIIDVSNESIDDAGLSLTDALSDVLRDTFSADLDAGLLYGAGPPEPTGLVAQAPIVGGAPANLRSAVIGGWGELTDAGAESTQVRAFATGSVLAAEWDRAATTAGTQTIPTTPFAGALQLGPVPTTPVPKLHPTDVLIADVTRTYLVVRQDFTVELSAHAGFEDDTTKLRVKGRFGVGIPAGPNKTVRKYVIAPAGTRTTAKS